jgi:Virulence factor BrkB
VRHCLLHGIFPCTDACDRDCGKHLISLYIGSSNMASTYGAAGALIIVFVWVYYSAQIFLLGGEFAKACGDRRRRLEGQTASVPTQTEDSLTRSWPGLSRPLTPMSWGFPWMPGTRACPRAARSAGAWAGHEQLGKLNYVNGSKHYE